MPRTESLRQRNDLVLAHEAGESALDAEDFPAAVDRGEHGGADDGVEAGRVAAAGRNGNSHYELRQSRLSFTPAPRPASARLRLRQE